MGAGNMIALLGALVAMHMGTLLYVSRKIDARLEKIDARLEKHSKMLSESDTKFETRMQASDAEHRQRMQEIDAEHRQLMKESDDKFEARIQAMRTENSKLLSDAGKLISANAEGITKLQVLVEASRKDVQANIEGMKDFRKTAAFQNQLLLKNNRSLGRIEGILGVQQIDETEEPPIPIYDVEADLEEDAEELEEIKERAEMTPDR